MFYSVRIYASLHSVPIYDIRTISIYTPCKLLDTLHVYTGHQALTAAQTLPM